MTDGRGAGPIMRVGDMARRPGLVFESPEDFHSPDDPLFRGAFWHRELRRGLFVHASDVFEDAGFTANSAQHAGLSCVFFLEGDVAVSIGDRDFRFHGEGRLNEGLVINSARAESFRRQSPGRQRIRHLVVSVTPEWLHRDGLVTIDDKGPANALIRDHMASRRWRTSARLGALVARLLSDRSAPSPVGALMMESAAVEIVAEALAASTGQDGQSEPGALSPRERARLARASEFVRADAGAWPTVEAIAREAGVSVSGLQRLFRAGYGVSVVEHVREVRLGLARDRLAAGTCTIQEAAEIAGYSSTANFTTAFRRHFGSTPGSVRKGQAGW